MENNRIIGQDFISIIKNLTKEERNLLLKLSNNVIDKAKKRGFPTYVNVNNYKWGNIIELCIKHNHQNIESGGGKPEYHFMNDFKYKEERGVKINDKLEFDVTTGQYDGDWDESTISTTKYLSIFEEKFKDGGSIKSKGTFNPLGSAKELGITPKVEGHDMIAKCDCGEKFSYQNSKKNIIWECPECKGMKRISESKMADGGSVNKKEMISGVLEQFILNTKFNSTSYPNERFAFAIDKPSANSIWFRTKYFGDWKDNIQVSIQGGDDFFRIRKADNESIKTTNYKLLGNMLNVLHKEKKQKYNDYLTNEYTTKNEIHNSLVD